MIVRDIRHLPVHRRGFMRCASSDAVLDMGVGLLDGSPLGAFFGFLKVASIAATHFKPSYWGVRPS